MATTIAPAILATLPYAASGRPLYGSPMRSYRGTIVGRTVVQMIEGGDNPRPYCFILSWRV